MIRSIPPEVWMAVFAEAQLQPEIGHCSTWKDDPTRKLVAARWLQLRIRGLVEGTGEMPPPAPAPVRSFNEPAEREEPDYPPSWDLLDVSAMSDEVEP